MSITTTYDGKKLYSIYITGKDAKEFYSVLQEMFNEYDLEKYRKLQADHEEFMDVMVNILGVS